MSSCHLWLHPGLSSVRALIGAVVRSSQTRLWWRCDCCCLTYSCKEAPAPGHVPVQIWGKSNVRGHRLRQELQCWASPKVCSALAPLSGLKNVAQSCPDLISQGANVSAGALPCCSSRRRSWDVFVGPEHLGSSLQLGQILASHF